MNCNIFKENIYHLFDEEISAKEKDEMLLHIENCDDCRQEYEELKALLSEIKPGIRVKASESLKSRIINQINKDTNMETQEKGKIIRMGIPRWAKIAVAAAIIIGAIVVVPFLKWNSNGDANAATTLFDKSIAAMMNLKSIYYNLNIRTAENENFETIETDQDFVKTEIWKKFSTPAKWKIDRAGRTLLMDGEKQYLYIKDNMAIKMGLNNNTLGWLKILLDPNLIMETEKNFALENKAKYTIEEKDNKVILTISAAAQGDFKNDFRLNTSIVESNNTRIYTFDKQSNLLLSFQIFMNKNNKSILVIDSKEIKYNEEMADDLFTISLPDGITWMDEETLTPSNTNGLKNINSEAAAKFLFDGLASNDWEKVEKLITDPLNNDFKTYYGGLKIINIGKSFKSGLYPGEFVPYEIILKSGETVKGNLSLRNDNKNKVWELDGGLQ